MRSRSERAGLYMLMALVKAVGVLVIALVGLFLVLANYSVSQSVMLCDGELHKDGEAVPGTAYLAIEKFRWWVHLWSDADGTLQVEMPDGYQIYYSRLERVGNGWHIWDGYGDRIEMNGTLSDLSGRLRLSTPIGVFEGMCTGEVPSQRR